MSEPSAYLQKGIFDALTGDAPLAVLMGGTARVFDRVPPNTPFPYITIGEDQVLEYGNSCEPDIFEAFSNIHCWSRSVPVGFVEAKRIAERVREILKTYPIVTGFTLRSCTTERVDHLRDGDGLTAHSIITQRFILQID